MVKREFFHQLLALDLLRCFDKATNHFCALRWAVFFFHCLSFTLSASHSFSSEPLAESSELTAAVQNLDVAKVPVCFERRSVREASRYLISSRIDSDRRRGLRKSFLKY